MDILTRGDGYPRKPDPAIYEAMIERHGFRREETLAIGDRGIDVLAGQAAGVRACLFGSASDQVAADFTIADYAELRRILVAERNQVFPGTAFHTVPVSLWEGKCS